MGKKPTGKPNGRPPVQIDQDQFEKLCGIQCTKEEIADFFGIDEDTLNAWCKRTYNCTFSVIFRQKRGTGKIALRRYGFEMAKTNPAVHIFYAKNHLGMTDHVEIQDNTALDKLDEIIKEVKANAVQR
jgi:hypothetical protein